MSAGRWWPSLPSCLLPSLPLTAPATHSVGASGYRSLAPLPLVCLHLFHCAATFCPPVPSPSPLPLLASPPLVTPLPLAVPLSFGWLLHFPVPQPLPHVALISGASASAIHHHHTSTFCRIPPFRLFFALPGASPPPSRRDSAQPPLPSRLRSVLPLVATLSFGWFLALPGASAYHTDGCIVATLHTSASCASTPLVCDSTWRCLPPIPPPYPSRMASSSPGCGPEEGLSPSGWCTVFREHHWRWAKEPVVRASRDNDLHKIDVDAVSPLINLGTQHDGRSARNWMKRV